MNRKSAAENRALRKRLGRDDIEPANTMNVMRLSLGRVALAGLVRIAPRRLGIFLRDLAFGHHDQPGVVVGRNLQTPGVTILGHGVVLGGYGFVPLLKQLEYGSQLAQPGRGIHVPFPVQGLALSVAKAGAG